MNQLPPEIWMKTFELLNLKDLLLCCLVCKKWNEIICSNKTTMTRLRLNVRNTKEKRVLETLNLNRIYRRILVEKIKIDNNFVKVIRKHGAEVTEIRFNCIGIWESHFTNFVSILSSLPKLETVIFWKCLGTNVLSKACSTVRMDNLQKIVFYCSDSFILDLIDAPNLRSLKFACLPSTLQLSKDQPQLQELAMTSFSERFDIKVSASSLRKLSIFAARVDEFEVADVLQNFKETIQQLEIRCEKYSSAILKLVFNQMPRLSLLKIHLGSLPTSHELLVNVKPNSNVNTLIVCSKSEYRSVEVKNIINFFPKILFLVLKVELNSDSSNEVMQFVSVNLPSLQSLEIWNVGRVTFHNVTIPTLSKLIVHDYFGSVNQLEVIAESCPNIKDLVIDYDRGMHVYSKLLNDTFVKAVQSFKKLRHLYMFIENFRASKDFYAVLLDEYPQLDSLTLNESALFKFKGWKNGKRFHLLEDFWHNVGTDFNVWPEEHLKK